MYDGVVGWPGENVGDEFSGKRSNKQRRDDDADGKQLVPPQEADSAACLRSRY
jgi:hypothetical protein